MTKATLRRAALTASLLGLGLTAGCGGDPGGQDELALGIDFDLARSSAVPPEQIARFEVGAIRDLPNNDCSPFRSRPIVDASLTCPQVATGSQLLELRDDEGHATRKLSFTPSLDSNRQSLSMRVPVGPATTIVIQAVDASGQLLGSGCAYVGRVSISSVEFNNPTAELNLDDSYTGCQPVLP